MHFLKNITDGHLLRRSPVAYSDGVYQPAGKDRPNPFVISRAAHEGTPGLGSLRGRTAFMVYFGKNADTLYQTKKKKLNCPKLKQKQRAH